MTQTMRIGIAAGLALAASAHTWAGKGSDQKAVRGASRATVQARTGASATGQRARGVVVSSYRPMEARSARGSSEVKPFNQARWLQEREGYRDGGY